MLKRRRHSAIKVHQIAMEKITIALLTTITITAMLIGPWDAESAREWEWMSRTSLTPTAISSMITILAARSTNGNKTKKRMARGAFSRLRVRSIFKEVGSFVQSRKRRHSRKSMRKLEMRGKAARPKLIGRGSCLKNRKIEWCKMLRMESSKRGTATSQTTQHLSQISQHRLPRTRNSSRKWTSSWWSDEKGS